MISALWCMHWALLFPSRFQAITTPSLRSIIHISLGVFLPYGASASPEHERLLLGSSARLSQAQMPKHTTAVLLKVSPTPGRRIIKLYTWTPLPKTSWALVFPWSSPQAHLEVNVLPVLGTHSISSLSLLLQLLLPQLWWLILCPLD